MDWRAQPPRCGQLTRCFSAVAELLVCLRLRELRRRLGVLEPCYKPKPIVNVRAC